MDIVLWIIAGLSLIGGTFMALEEERVIWFVSGIISFALFGGFASVIGFLKEQLSRLSELKEELALLRQERKPDPAPSADGGKKEIAEQKEEVKQRQRIFYCPKCKRGFRGDSSKNCPVCSSPTVDTSILVDEWNSFTDQEKQNMIHAFSMIQF